METLDSPARKRQTARNRFLAACSLAGASTTAYRSRSTAEGDQTYWLDVARLGSPDAPGVLVLACALNGDEGYCGSTVMTEWLEKGHQRDIPRDVGLVMLHAVLPAGYANIGAPAPQRLEQRSWSDTVLSAAARRFASYAERAGLKPSERRAAGERPVDDTSWMETACDAVAAEIAGHAQRIALLEFHTGLQPYGTTAVASCHPPDSAATGRLRAWLGDESQSGDTASLDIFGLGFGARLADLTLTAAHVAFGIYTTRRILQLEARGTPAERRADIQSLFSPDSDDWREHLGAEGSRIIGCALRGMAY